MASPEDVEFRRVESERYPEYREIVDYAFDPTAGPQSYDGPEDVPDRIADRFGVFDGDELVSVCAHYDFEARLRGGWAPLAGLAAVATPPEHRRQGYVREAVEASLRQWRGEYPLAALWPFDRSYYEQFGWATACKRVEYALPPGELAFVREREGEHERDAGVDAGTDTGRDDVRFRRVDPDDWERLQRVHEAHAVGRELTLRRDEAWWRRRVFRSLDDDERYVYACERDGEARGYVAYTIDESGDRELSVHDLAFVDHEAYRSLLGFLADHDSQVGAVTFEREAETTLLDLVEDPSAVECEVRTGPMVRVVDVVHALEGLPYPPGAAADLTLRIADETAPWNDVTVRLRVDDGERTCERIDADGNTDARLDVGTLSQLAVGYLSVRGARRVADLDVRRETAAETLADLFPPKTVYLRDFF